MTLQASDGCPLGFKDEWCCGQTSACAEPEPELDHFEETGCDCEMDEEGDDYYEVDEAPRVSVPRNTLLSAYAAAHRLWGDPGNLIELEELLSDFLVALGIEVTD